MWSGISEFSVDGRVYTATPSMHDATLMRASWTRVDEMDKEMRLEIRVYNP